MADRFGEPRPTWWPVLLLLLGIGGVLPLPSARKFAAGAEELLLSAARWVDPRTLFAVVPAPRDSTTRIGADGRIAAFLDRARAAILPPPGVGWHRDGTFHALAVGAVRSPKEITLAVACPVPADEAAFLGRELVGFTAVGGAGTRIVPILAKGTRLPASVGISGDAGARCLVLGEGGATLRIAYADEARPIAPGDPVYAVDPPPVPGAAVASRVGGALLGHAEPGALAAGADRVEWRVRPLTPLTDLVEVAVRFPPGFPGPADADLVGLVVEPPWATPIDRRRRGWFFAAGRERGVVAGAAVSSGPLFLGRVERAGWRHALVRRIEDPGFQLGALLLFDGRIVPWSLDVVAADGTRRVALRAPPPVANWDGGLVVTAASAEGVPEGLLIGTLQARGASCLLELERPDEPELTIHRPAGAWSAAR